jgi:hypothetical protein
MVEIVSIIELIVANLPDIRLPARMQAILSAKLADPDAFSGSDLVIFRPFLSLCDPHPDRKPWLMVDAFGGKFVKFLESFS